MYIIRILFLFFTSRPYSSLAVLIYTNMLKNIMTKQMITVIDIVSAGMVKAECTENVQIVRQLNKNMKSYTKK